MLWDGNRQAQEYTDTHVFTTIYEQESFEPVARLVWLRDGLNLAANDEPDEYEQGWYGNNKPEPPDAMQIYHYHNDHLGTPNELTNSQGEVVWLADYQAWGGVAKNVYVQQFVNGIEIDANDLQPIRFQGQFFDSETELHYNRFRYYDNNLGMFTTRDPIGLEGGNNTFQYAPNPTGWIDPFGLKKCPSIAERMREAGLHGLPSKGTYRYLPPRGYNPCNPLPKGKNGGYIDRFENEWVQGPYHGDPSKPFFKEWDVQLSPIGEGKWNIRGGASKSQAKGVSYYINVRPDGMKSH